MNNSGGCIVSIHSIVGEVPNMTGGQPRAASTNYLMASNDPTRPTGQPPAAAAVVMMSSAAPKVSSTLSTLLTSTSASAASKVKTTSSTPSSSSPSPNSENSEEAKNQLLKQLLNTNYQSGSDVQDTSNR